MKKRIILSLYLLCALMLPGLYAQEPVVAEAEDCKEWTVLMYMNTDGLAPHAIQNLNDAASRIRNKTTNAFAFCNHLPGKAWLWKLKNGELKQHRYYDNINTHGQELVELMHYLKDEYPAKRYAVVLWGHGSGVIDMQLNPSLGKFEYPNADTAKICISCMQGKALGGMPTRGILYDDTAQTSLPNEELYESLRRIKEDVLGRNLDVLFTDACAMGNIEVAKRVGEYVNCFTGTQDCEMVDGIPYNKFFNTLNQFDVSGKQLTQAVVSAYGDYHNLHAPDGRHTYVGLEVNAHGLNTAQELWHRFEQFMNTLERALSDHPELAIHTHYLREQALESSVNSDYIDLQHWVHLALDFMVDALPDNDYDLQEAALNFDRQFEQVVIANITGHASAGKSGLSIYYPKYWVHGDFHDSSNVWHRYLQASVESLHLPQPPEVPVTGTGDEDTTGPDTEGQKWNVLYYIYGNPDDNTFLRESLLEGAKKLSGNAEVFVEWHHQNNLKRWHLDGTGSYNQTKELWYNGDHQDATMVSAAEWAFADQTRRNAMVLVGYGAGLVNLVWNHVNASWEWPSEHNIHLQETRGDHTAHRGMFYDYFNSSAMRSGQLVEACRRIKHDVLGGRNIDLMIADTDGLASPELFLLPMRRTDVTGTSYLADHVNYFVGSQDMVIRGSIDHNLVADALISPAVSTHDAAAKIVADFQSNIDNMGYDYSSLCAWHVPALHQAGAMFNQIIDALNQVVASSPNHAAAIYNARGTTHSTSMAADYVDVEAWLTQISNALSSSPLADAELQSRIIEGITQLKAMHESVVFARAEREVEGVRSGASIYYPQYWYDPTLIERDSTWGQFVHNSVEYWRTH